MFGRVRPCGEAALLKDFLNDAGLTHDFLIENQNNYCFQDPVFYMALRYFVRKEKLSVLDALSQLKDLRSSEIQILLDLYRDGLRGQHFRRYHRVNVHRDMDVFAIYQKANAADYFKAVFRSVIKQNKTPLRAFLAAVNELAVISRLKLTESPAAAKGMRFLIRHINDGVRARDIGQYFISKKTRNMISYLQIFFNLDIKHALAQVDGLSDDEIHFLKKYFYADVRKNHIKNYPHSLHDVEMIIQELRLYRQPLRTLTDLGELDNNQFNCLCDFVKMGLDIDTVKTYQFPNGYNDAVKDLVLTLVHQKGYDLLIALSAIDTKSEQELQDSLQEETLQFTSFRLCQR